MHAAHAYRLLAGACSDIGSRRADNQDSGFASDQLLLIADGVGGSPAGGLASATIVRALAVALAGLATPDEQSLRAQFIIANAELARLGRAEPEVRGMATTLTGLFVAGDQGYLLHIGDSRAYRLRDGELQQLTSDQSWVQMLLDEGMLDPADAPRHPMRNLLMHSLSGALSDPEAVRISAVDLRLGDRWLVASDGLTSYLPADLLAAQLGSGASAQEVADALVTASWTRSHDNISAVIGDVSAGKPDRQGFFVGAARHPGQRTSRAG